VQDDDTTDPEHGCSAGWIWNGSECVSNIVTPPPTGYPPGNPPTYPPWFPPDDDDEETKETSWLVVEAPSSVKDGETFNITLKIMHGTIGGTYKPFSGSLPKTVALGLDPANGISFNQNVVAVTWYGGVAMVGGCICSNTAAPSTMVGVTGIVIVNGKAISALDPMEVKGKPADMTIPSPITLKADNAGAHITWSDIVISNSVLGTFLNWTATMVSDTGSALHLSKMAATGTSYKATENIVLTLSPVPAVGTYTATVVFTAPYCPDVTVTINYSIVKPNMTVTSAVTLECNLAGTKTKWDDITITNSESGTKLQWSAAKLLDNTPANQIKPDTAIFTPPGLDGSQVIVLSLSSIPAAGTYYATYEFSAPGVTTVTVAVTLIVTPTFTGVVPCVVSWTGSSHRRNMNGTGSSFGNLTESFPKIEILELDWPGAWPLTGWIAHYQWHSTGWANKVVTNFRFDPATGCPMGSVWWYDSVYTHDTYVANFGPGV
jgi:hypothetical protein